jgi:sarcosine oxidase subunit beta
MKTVADVVVIGGGVHGCSMAYHLAKAGLGKIILIDKSGVASGPTAKSGAMIRGIFNEVPYIQLVEETLGLMENWTDAIGGDPGFVERGFLRITRTFDEESLGGNLDLMRQLGVKFELLDADALASRVPDGQFAGNECGLWLPRAGYADPVRTTQALAKAAARLGVVFREGERVKTIRAFRGRVMGVSTERDEISTRLVVNCAGPWSTRLAKGIGVRLPIETHRTCTSLFQRPAAIPIGTPILSDGVNRVYFRDVGETLLRAAHFGWTRNEVDPDDYNETISERQLALLRNALRPRYRSMRPGIYAGGFAAVYDMTPDSHPIIGNIGGVDGFWCNCGWSGNGFASAASVGRHIVARIKGEKTNVDLSMFHWPRPAGTKMRPDGRWVKR